jgi:hypothetical protein
LAERTSTPGKTACLTASRSGGGGGRTRRRPDGAGGAGTAAGGGGDGGRPAVPEAARRSALLGARSERVTTPASPSTLEPIVLSGSLVSKPAVSLRALLDSGAGLDAVSDGFACAQNPWSGTS